MARQTWKVTLKWCLGVLLFLTFPIDSGIQSASARPLIGIGYMAWYPEIPGGYNFWKHRWGTPLLGTYKSADPLVIEQHAQWLDAMGADFILIGWSNNIANDINGNFKVGRTIIANTDAVFADYEALSASGKPHPKIAILMGAQNQQGVTCNQAISSQYFREELEHIYKYTKQYSNIYFRLDGKPLLVIYLGTPACTTIPPWDDARFTVRWETGYLESQPALYGGNPRRNSYWSWIDRRQIPAYREGDVDAITAVQAYPGRRGWLGKLEPSAGRSGFGGLSTFERQWRKAVSYNPKVIFLGPWNNFTGTRPDSDQFDIEFSNDIEPTVDLGCTPMVEVQKAVAAVKRISLRPFTGPCRQQPPDKARPIGFVDGISSDGKVSGWAYDPDSPSQSITINVYAGISKESGSLIGSTRTTVHRAEVNTKEIINGKHGFSWQIPRQYLHGRSPISVYGVDAQTREHIDMLGGSPKFILN